MRRTLFQYVSLLILSFVFGTELFGMNYESAAKEEVYVEESSSDIAELSTGNIDHQGAIEQTLVFSNQQISFGSSREQLSLFLYRTIQLSSSKSNLTFQEKHLSRESFDELLALRHKECFYVYNLRKIIV